MGPFYINFSAQGVILNPAEASVDGAALASDPGRSPARGEAFTRRQFTKKHSVRGFCSKGDGHNEAVELQRLDWYLNFLFQSWNCHR